MTDGSTSRGAGRQRIAVIGAGVSGLGAAWALARRHDVTVFEANAYPGGHSNTASVDYDGRIIPVDTGFIVFNDRNYPNLLRLFRHLDVPAIPSNMSFAVSVGAPTSRGQLEWSGSGLTALFAQPRNLLRPTFHGMLRDILRFNRIAAADLATDRLAGRSLGDYLMDGSYGEAFRLDYLLPMGAAIWSTPLGGMMDFPAETFIRFFHNHGLLTLKDRPQWFTVAGGSREYVRRLIADGGFTLHLNMPVRSLRREGDGAALLAGGRTQHFDQVVLACHGDQALMLLGDQATAAERAVLSAFRFQPNRAVLHRDPALMPRRRRVWSSWNYLSEPRRDLQRRVALTYWMNRLQSIDDDCPLFVTLNPVDEPAPDKVFAEFAYEHPLFDRGAVDAQVQLPQIQGRDRLWFCGAWCRYGFHEDGLTAGLAIAAQLGVADPFSQSSPQQQQAAE